MREPNPPLLLLEVSPPRLGVSWAKNVPTYRHTEAAHGHYRILYVKFKHVQCKYSVPMRRCPDALQTCVSYTRTPNLPTSTNPIDRLLQGVDVREKISSSEIFPREGHNQPRSAQTSLERVALLANRRFPAKRRPFLFWPTFHAFRIWLGPVGGGGPIEAKEGASQRCRLMWG